jgi:hypothetical protein
LSSHIGTRSAFQHTRRTLDGAVQVKDVLFQGLLASKGEHPLHQLSAALGGLVDLLDHRREFRIGRNTGGGQLCHADDHGCHRALPLAKSAVRAPVPDMRGVGVYPSNWGRVYPNILMVTFGGHFEELTILAHTCHSRE